MAVDLVRAAIQLTKASIRIRCGGQRQGKHEELGERGARKILAERDYPVGETEKCIGRHSGNTVRLTGLL